VDAWLAGRRTRAELADRWPEIVSGGGVLGRGRADGPTLVEFTDYRCPFCARAQAEVDAVLGDGAGVRVVVRHLPLDALHPDAPALARVAVCAEADPAFPAIHRALFHAPDPGPGRPVGSADGDGLGHGDRPDPRERLGVGDHPRAGDRALRKLLAGAGAADPDSLLLCARSERAARRVRADVRMAVALGLDGTPTFLTRRRVEPGVLSAERLREMLGLPQSRPRSNPPDGDHTPSPTDPSGAPRREAPMSLTAPLVDRLWPLLERELFSRPGDEGTFNPWRDRDDRLDVDDAAAIRRRNLRGYLGSFREPPPVVLVGEAPSWRGCRFSGIAFTAEANLLDDTFPVDGRRTSAFRERPLTEASATIVWGCLQEHFPRFLLWNALPFHPHPPRDPLGNRTPRRTEVESFAGILRGVLDALGPEEVLAVGRTSERALEGLGIEARYVRHPSHGGARKFTEGVLEVLG
jgi:protein-disulfide isomerase